MDKFSVNKDNAVRFGMGAIKGVGQGAVETIVENRKKDGLYKTIFDFTEIKYFRAISAHCEQAAPAWNMVLRLF